MRKSERVLLETGGRGGGNRIETFAKRVNVYERVLETVIALMLVL